MDGSWGNWQMAACWGPLTCCPASTRVWKEGPWSADVLPLPAVSGSQHPRYSAVQCSTVWRSQYVWRGDREQCGRYQRAAIPFTFPVTNCLSYSIMLYINKYQCSYLLFWCRYSGSKKCPNICLFLKYQIGVIFWHNLAIWPVYVENYNILAFRQALSHMIWIKTD